MLHRGRYLASCGCPRGPGHEVLQTPLNKANPYEITIVFFKYLNFPILLYNTRVLHYFLAINSEILFNDNYATGYPPQQFREIFDGLI